MFRHSIAYNIPFRSYLAVARVLRVFIILFLMYSPLYLCETDITFEILLIFNGLPLIPVIQYIRTRPRNMTVVPYGTGTGTVKFGITPTDKHNPWGTK
jgi:hypothetical protein